MVFLLMIRRPPRSTRSYPLFPDTALFRSRLGRVVEDVQAVIPPVDGQDLMLSIDAGLQFDTFTALKKALDEHKAKAGAGIVIDVHTGEILALVNLPTYDPKDPDERKGPALRNRAITATFAARQHTRL